MFRIFVDFGEFLFPFELDGRSVFKLSMARRWARDLAVTYGTRVLVQRAS